MASEVLTERQAEIWSLRHVEKLKLRDIGARLGVSLSSVHKTLQKAEKKVALAPPEETPPLATPMERVVALAAELDRAISNASDQEAIRLARDLRARALTMADNQTLAQESGKGLVQIAQGATNMIQLLTGEPTAITQFRDMRKLDELAEALDKELKRRGKLIEVKAEVVG